VKGSVKEGGRGQGKLAGESAEEKESVAAGASSCVSFVLCLAVLH
jgi:hypothetical protein